uniref:Fas-activated serine/threonine kinase n=1 Tax=Petromyzon marinus TaxID=7757 RepID=S4RY51_PETMA
MKRLLERSCSPEEVLRWLAQNPGKVAPSHYPVALQRLGHILQHQQQRGGTNSPDFKALCEAVAKNCSQFDNFSVVNCLYALATLGKVATGPCTSAEKNERRSRRASRQTREPGKASNKSLELIFSSQLFYENRQEKFINKLAEELPKKVDSMSPHTMAIIAKYLARHRLREPRLLDTIAHFLINKAEMNLRVLQKLVFPFSRMNYKPPSERKLVERLEAVLAQKALHSPLATVNIIMSMVQLNHFPAASLGKVFSPPFLRIIMNSPYGVIVRRYLSLLDAAIALECPSYSGPRLPDQYKVTMFDHALTADEVNRKYSYKGFVAEALRQLVGAQCFKQDEVLPPGYYTDFLLFMDDQKRLLPTDGNSNLDNHPVNTCNSAAASIAAPTAPPDQWIVMSVNDKWHYCHSSDVLVGSRAMRDRHLRLLGYHIVQLPYHDLEKLNGIEEVKKYLQRKLNEL